MTDMFTVTAELRQKVTVLKEALDRAQERIAYYEGRSENCVEGALGVVGHRFNSEGICIRCNTDAEEHENPCTEGILRQLWQKESVIEAIEAQLKLFVEHYGGYLIADLNEHFTQKLINEKHPAFVDENPVFTWVEGEGAPTDRSTKLIRNQHGGWEKAWYEDGRWFGGDRRNGVFNWWSLPDSPKKNPNGWLSADSKKISTDPVLVYADRTIDPQYAENGDLGIFIASFDGENWRGGNHERKTDWTIQPVTHWMFLPTVI